MGELHLEILVDRMKREFSVEANIGSPQVAYREAIKKQVTSEGKFVKQSGGKGQYGHVWLRIEPNEQGKGYEFIDEIKGGTVPREFIPAVDKGLRETITAGVLAGYPIEDVKLRFTMVLIMTLTQMKMRLKWRLPLRLKMDAKKLIQFYLNP